jgi:hypothetical protein
VTSAPAEAASLRPVVLSVTPARGWVTGGTAVTITGKRFTAGAKVKLAAGNSPGANAIPATKIKVVSSTKITAITGHGAKLGSFNVFVTTKGGTSAATAADKYSYIAASAWGTPTEIPAPGSASARPGWRGATELRGSASGQALFTSVSCSEYGTPRANTCTLVGQDGNNQPFYVIYQAIPQGPTTWSTPAEITGTPGGSGTFTSVSCVDGQDCMAVGQDGNNQPFYVIETNNVWGAPTEIIGTPGGSGSFTSVNCQDDVGSFPLYCAAVGQDGNNQPFYVNFLNNNVRGTPTEITGTPGGSGTLTSVNCTFSGDNCQAVGQDGNKQPFYVNSDNYYSWGPPTEITGTPGGSGTLTSVYWGGGFTAVGQDGNNQPFAVIQSGSGVYGPPTEITGTPGGSGDLSSANCYGGYLFCTAVGQDGNNQPFTVTLGNGIWGGPVEITGSPGGSGLFTSVDGTCEGDGYCMAVGQDGNGQPMYDIEAPTSAPTVSSVSPNSGPVTGGTPITITGSNFLPGAVVEIAPSNGLGSSAVPATNVTVVSPTQITATTGGGASPGTYGVYVITAGGVNTDPSSSAGQFTYTP